MLVIDGIEYVKKETIIKGCSYEVNRALSYPQRDFIFIPNNINGMPVKRILSGAFFGNTSWKSIQLGKNIEHIEEGAFCSCKALKEITLPKGVKGLQKNLLKES